METGRGTVVSVSTRPIGDVLAGDHVSGVTELVVSDGYPFSEDGGELSIDGDVYEYSGWVDDETTDTDTILLTGPTSADYDDNSLVALMPLEDEKIASVVQDGDGASIESLVPHDLFDKVAEGIRDPGYELSVDFHFDGDDYILDNVVGRTPVIDGSLIDPETPIPEQALTDGIPPAASPDCVTLGGLKQVFVKWDAISNRDLVTYEIHVDTASFVAVAGDLATMVVETPSTMAPVKNLADGTPFEYDTDYFFQIIAKDADGAAAPGVEVVGRMDQTASGDIVAGAVTTELLDSVLAIVGILQVGSLIEVTPPGGVVGALTGGIVVKDPVNPGGAPMVRLHPLGCFFRGELQANILTVMQDLVINGDASLSSGASFRIRNGVSDPDYGPAITQGPIQSAWPVVPAGYSQRGICWDPTGGQWVRLLRNNTNLRGYMQTVSTAGVAGTVTLLGVGSILAGSENANSASGITVVGTSVYYVQQTKDGIGDYRRYIVKCSLSTGTYQSSVSAAGVSAVAFLDQAALGTDGTYLYMHESEVVARWSTALVDSGYSHLTGATAQFARFVSVSNYGYGAAKLTIAYDTFVDVYALPAFTVDSVAKDAALSWELDLTMTNGGIAYKTSGSDQGFYSTHGDNLLSRWSDYYPSTDENFYMKYADKGAGLDRTGLSVGYSVLDIGKRRFAFATLRPAPPGVVDAELYVGYGTSPPADTAFYKRPELISERTFTLTGGKRTSTDGRLATVAITNRALTSNVATLTAAGHGYAVGQIVAVSSVPTDTFFNGTFVITAVTTNTYSYALVHANVASVASSGSGTTIPANTLGVTPADVFDDFGNSWRGDGEVNLPGLVTNEYYQLILVTAANPTSTTNVTLAEFVQSVDCPGTDAVYEVSISADITVTTGSNIVELLVDGVANPAQIISVGAGRGTAYKAWGVTGLAAGSRTFTARTRNTAGSTNCTVNSVHSLMTVKRIR